MIIDSKVLLGLISTLISTVIGLATMLLVWWQAPFQRKSQVMMLYLASVTLWGLAGFLLHLAVMLDRDPTRLLHLLGFAIGLNSLCMFVLAAHFARLDGAKLVRLAIFFGVTCLIAGGLLLLAGRLLVLREVTPDGRFLFGYTPIGLPLIGLLLLYSIAALLVVWRHRHGLARPLLAGVLLQVIAIVAGLIPELGAYAIDTLGSAAASLIFARLILQEQLFGRLARLNAEFAASNSRLAASNAQLTALSQELRATADDLRQARDVAEAGSRAKSTFLATMSHELRTPLTAILGYSELLQFDLDQLGQPALVDDLARIRRAGTHLLTLINNVLDLSKIEAGKIELNMAEVNLQTLLHDLATIVTPLARSQGNRLSIERATSLVCVDADKIRLRQVLLNILGNACKFTENGTISLVVADADGSGVDRPARLAADRTYMLFEVRDTGIGIGAHEQDRLFEAFTQVGIPPKHKHDGTGLGLAIARQLCRLMGGEITLSSAAGQGTRVTVWLPASCGSELARHEADRGRIAAPLQVAEPADGNVPLKRVAAREAKSQSLAVCPSRSLSI